MADAEYILNNKNAWRGKIAERLTALRARAKCSRLAVARAIHKTAQSVFDYENGRVSIPSETVCRLAIFYDCSVDFILLGFGWGGVEVADYDELIHSLPDIPHPDPKAAKPRGPGVKVKPAPKAPVVPRVIKASKIKKGKKKSMPAPTLADKPKKRGRMMYDFSLD